MSYDPGDHNATLRQVFAGWALCLAIIGLAGAATEWYPAARSGDPSSASEATACAPNPAPASADGPRPSGGSLFTQANSPAVPATSPRHDWRHGLIGHYRSYERDWREVRCRVPC
jgi:hypothetical protein